MRNIKRVVLAICLSLALAFGAVSVSSSIVSAASAIAVSGTAPGYADTPAYQPCSYGATGTVYGASQFSVRPWYNGCTRNKQKFVCVRLMKYGISVVKQICQGSSGDIGHFGPSSLMPCVAGLNYSLEVLFFVGYSSYMIESSVNLHCDGYA